MFCVNIILLENFSCNTTLRGCAKAIYGLLHAHLKQNQTLILLKLYVSSFETETNDNKSLSK